MTTRALHRRALLGLLATLLLAPLLLAWGPGSEAAPSPRASVVTLAKDCSTHDDHHYCVRVLRSGDRRWAKATVRADGPDAPFVDVQWVKLRRYSCTRHHWYRVEYAEGPHTYQSPEATLRTRSYLDTVGKARYRAAAEFVARYTNDGAAYLQRTRAVGHC
ncbi:MAG: hypothetical protein ACR2K3_12890 [Nocardioides sp.]